MTRATIAVLMLLIGPAAAAGQRPGAGRPLPAGRAELALPGEQGAGPRRRALQQLVVQRFMDRASLRLGLTPAQRDAVQQIVLANEIRRRDLTRQARVLRAQLAQAAADSTTPPADFDRLLQQMRDLRARDLALWQNEQDQLGRVLTPRQRAQFMAMRIEFFEMVQRARARGAQPGAPLGP